MAPKPNSNPNPNANPNPNPKLLEPNATSKPKKQINTQNMQNIPWSAIKIKEQSDSSSSIIRKIYRIKAESKERNKIKENK